MKITFFLRLLPYTFFLYTGISLGVVPITVTFNNGTTNFTSSASGTANYIVNVKEITPANAPIIFHAIPNSSNGLVASQITTGPSLCSSVNTICSSPTFALQANQSCCLQYALTSNKAGNYILQPSVSSNPVATYSAKAISSLSITISATNVTPLTVTPSILALSVNCPAAATGCAYTNVALTGNPRQITIQNTSTTDTTSPLTVTSGAFPAGTIITADNCTGITLAPQKTCTITITPGQVASADAVNNVCTTGIQPVAATITVNASSAPSAVSPSVYVLSYGCQYQGGFLYSVDDTANNGQTGACSSPPCTGSIGGKIIALTDQAPTFPDGIVWSSNGGTGQGSAGHDPADTSYDTIPGVDYASTVVAGSPTYTVFSIFFAIRYTNANPFTSASFAMCNGKLDGACNTNNILTFYNEFITNNTEANGGSPPFTASNGPTPLTYYAAGRCSNYTIDSAGNSPCITGTCYNNWYLPAICEMGSHSNGPLILCSTAHEQNIADNLTFLLSDTQPCTTPPGCLAGNYWSSTEHALTATQNVVYELFRTNGPGTQISNPKYLLNGVRCSRALTF